MFLFPWFDYGIDILKFEKSHFLAARVILGDFSSKNDIFCISDPEGSAQKNLRSEEKFSIF